MVNTDNLFAFNKVYVIESLKDNDPRSGQDLYNDIIVRTAKRQNDQFSHELFVVNTCSELKEKIGLLVQRTANASEFPMIHFEIHGNKDGFVLGSGELLKWEELYMLLAQINLNIGNNLFITSAVCYGGYLLQIVQLDAPCPFYGIIGSFDELTYSEHMESYSEFYQEFLTTCHLTDSLNAFHEANKQKTGKFSFIFTDEVFMNAYAEYTRLNSNPAFREKRAKEAVLEHVKSHPLPAYLDRVAKRKEIRRLEKLFLKRLQAKQDGFYRDTVNSFFMLKYYPENRARFDIPESYEEMQKKKLFRTKVIQRLP